MSVETITVSRPKPDYVVVADSEGRHCMVSRAWLEEGGHSIGGMILDNLEYAVEVQG